MLCMGITIFNVIFFFIMLLCGLESGCVCLAIAIYIFIAIPLTALICDAVNKTNNRETKTKMIKQQKRQEKYDNECGVIDFKEKDK